MPSRKSWASLCELSELTEGQGKFVQIDGFQLAVFIDNNQVFVIDNECPHAGGSLSSGDVQDGCVICPLHGWAFRLPNGQHRDLEQVTVHSYRTRLLERPGQPTLVQVELP
jgi:nitrite reductase/ring-hydroxylating ferredoxin subunit